jgi:hypothetical protein
VSYALTSQAAGQPLEIAGLSGPALVAAGIVLILLALLVINRLPRR